MDDTHAESDTAEAGAVGPAALTGAGTGAAGLGAAAAAGAVAGIPGGALRALLGGTLGAAIGAAGGGALGVLTDRATARPDSSKAAAPVDHDPEPPSPTTDDRGVDR